MKRNAADVSDVRDTDIVVGVDGSSSSRGALRWALEQARLTRARVRAVIAWELPAYHGWSPGTRYEDFPAHAGKVLDEAVHDAIDDDRAAVEVLQSVEPGHPAQVLLDASAHAALLVIGSRGLGGFTGTLLGSVSQQCLQHARCPVVVIRGRNPAGGTTR